MRHSRIALVVALVFAPSQAPAQTAYEITITTAQANVRLAPNLQAEIVTSLKAGTVLNVLGKEGAWYRVRVQGLERNQGVAFIHESVAKITETTGGSVSGPEPSVVSPTKSNVELQPPAAPRALEAPRLRPEDMPGYRSPTKAKFYGYFAPGAGHFYTGDSGAGVGYFTVGVGGLLLGRMLSKHFEETQERFYDAELGAVSECIGNVFSTFFCEHPSIPKYVGYGLLGVSWLAAIGDAPKSAERMNAKRGILINTGRLEPRIESTSDGRTYLGATLYLHLNKEGN